MPTLTSAISGAQASASGVSPQADGLPRGMTAKAISAMKTERAGAIRKTKGLARVGRICSLKGHLDPVGDGLKKAKRTSAIGAKAALEAREDATLDQGHVGERGEQRDDEDRALDHGGDDHPGKI